MRDVDGLAHDVDLARVGPPVVRPQVSDLEPVVVADADPGKELTRFLKFRSKINYLDLSVVEKDQRSLMK